MATRRLVWGAAGVGLLLRLLHLREILPLELGREPLVGMDRWLSMHMATAVADGRWLGGWAAPYENSPGYAYLLGLVYWSSGRRWLLALIVQVLLGALVPFLLYGVGARVASARVGVIAAWLAAVYAPFLFYETLLVKYALLPVTVSLVLLATIGAHQRDSRAWAAAAGAALGVLILLRPNTVLVAPVVLLAIALGRRGLAGGLLLSAVATTMLVLSPMVLRDRIASRQALTSSQWGLHFYIGSNQHADGTYVPVAGLRDDVIGHIKDARQLAERRAGHALSPMDVSWYWFRRGWRFPRRHPGAYARLQLRKVWLAFHADELGSFGEEFHDFRRASWVLRLPLISFGVVAPFGLLGLGLTMRGRSPAVILPLFAGAFVVSLLPFFVEGRYRLPLVPPLLVLAAIGLAWLGEAWRARRPRMLLIGAATIVVALVAVAADWRQALMAAVVLMAVILSEPRTSAVR